MNIKFNFLFQPRMRNRETNQNGIASLNKIDLRMNPTVQKKVIIKILMTKIIIKRIVMKKKERRKSGMLRNKVRNHNLQNSNKTIQL